MIVKFQKRTLETCFKDHRKASKSFDEQIARKYIQRINIIQQSQNLHELMSLPGLRCHALKGVRKGEYAINLSGFYRLIFTMTGNRLEIVMIEEVSKHYGD